MHFFTVPLNRRVFVVQKIVELGISESEAHTMVQTFCEHGGLACVLRWPEQFSMFAPTRNALDCLMEEERGDC